jgi:hypothetical protein
MSGVDSRRNSLQEEGGQLKRLQHDMRRVMKGKEDIKKVYTT